MPLRSHDSAEKTLAKTIRDDDAVLLTNTRIPSGSEHHKHDDAAHHAYPPPYMLTMALGGHIDDNLADPDEREGNADTKHANHATAEDTESHACQLLPGPDDICLIITLLHGYWLFLRYIVVFVSRQLRGQRDPKAT